jgi:PAS domain S-box-containing protein
MSVSVRSERAAVDLTPLFAGSLDILCIRDLQGRFIRANRAWERALGYTADELEGAPLLPLIHAEDSANTRSRMAYADQDGDIMGFVNRYRSRDGRYRHLEWRARRMGDVVFGVARDVTERLAIEAQLRAADQAKRDLLAAISHEIRTPLNGVVNLVEAFGRIELTPDQHETLQLIASSRKRLERLIWDVLDISKTEAQLKRQASDLGGELDRPIEIDTAREGSNGAAPRDGACAQESFAGPPVTKWRGKTSPDELRARSNFQGAVQCWAFENLKHFGSHPTFHRSFRDFPSQVLGFLTLYLNHTGHLHLRSLQTLSSKTGIISTGRTTALLLRMQDIEFIQPAETFRTGKARRYRPLPAMVKAFADHVMVDLKSATLIDPRVASLVEELQADEQRTIAFLAAFAEVLIADPEVPNISAPAPLNGAPLMAMGKLIALAIAADAMERRGDEWEGPIDIALASYARRFEVSRAQVRRVLQTLEPCGLARVPDNPHRLLITRQFREAVETCYAAMFDTILRTLDRYQQAELQGRTLSRAG